MIKSVNDSTAQHLFVVDRDGTELLIPMHDEIIQSVDRQKREIHIIAPEGLIELYL